MKRAPTVPIGVKPLFLLCLSGTCQRDPERQGSFSSHLEGARFAEKKQIAAIRPLMNLLHTASLLAMHPKLYLCIDLRAGETESVYLSPPFSIVHFTCMCDAHMYDKSSTAEASFSSLLFLPILYVGLHAAHAWYIVSFRTFPSSKDSRGIRYGRFFSFFLSTLRFIRLCSAVDKIRQDILGEADCHLIQFTMYFKCGIAWNIDKQKLDAGKIEAYKQHSGQVSCIH